jgi:hypothetical protein
VRLDLSELHIASRGVTVMLQIADMDDCSINDCTAD